MTIPETLKVAGFTFKVVKSKEIAAEGRCYGSTHHTSQTIYLDPDNTEAKMEQTFLHEILHSVWACYGLVKRKDLTEQQEEEVIDALSMGLYQVLKDNNLLV